MNLVKGPRRRRFALTGIVIAAASAVLISGAGARGEVARVESLSAQAGVLGEQVEILSEALDRFAPRPPAAIGANSTIIVAQSSRDMASINVRLGQLEEQIRGLTGQVEGLQFQMTQMQTFLERLQEDYEFRFQQLEGGGLGKTSAVTQSESETLSGELSQTQDLMAPESIDFISPDIVIDPLAEGFTLGSPETPLGTIPADAVDLSGRPLDLNFSSPELVTNDDADAQYRAGYDAVVRGDYSFAEDQFRQFVALFPDHPQAPDAINWLGEALILREAYSEAADVLLSGFQSYPNSTRAPDLLLKLGMALSGAGEHDTACRTFDEVSRRFNDISTSFKARLGAEMSKAQC